MVWNEPKHSKLGIDIPIFVNYSSFFNHLEYLSIRNTNLLLPSEVLTSDEHHILTDDNSDIPP